MYIRKSTRSYRGKTYTSHLLVESVQTPKGPRQRTVCSLGDLSPRPRKEWLKLACKVEDALVGQGDLLDPDDGEVADIVRRVRARRARGHGDRGVNDETLPAPPQGSSGGLIKVDPTRVTTERHREAGPVHVGHQFWRRLGLDDILRDCKLSAAARDLACAMTLNRLIAPCSEHAMPDWIRRTALADILGVDFEALEEDPLYLVLDKLHPQRSVIEAALVERERSLFNLDATIYLYDLTSTYFGGSVCPQCQGQAGLFARSSTGLQAGRRRAGRQPRGLSDHPRGVCRKCPGPHDARHHARPPDRARRPQAGVNRGGRPRHGV